MCFRPIPTGVQQHAPNHILLTVCGAESSLGEASC